MGIIIGSFSAQGGQLGTTTSKATHTGTGVYEVTFSQAFSTQPSVVVTPQTDNLGKGGGYVVSVSIENVSSTGFSLFIQNLSSPAQNEDAGFSFIASASN